MKGELIGVGVGPGNPNLLTLKAVQVLQETDVIGIPNVKGRNNTALDIVKEYIEGKDKLMIDTPMIKNQSKTGSVYQLAAQKIIEILNKGKNVAFITLGDPTIYSTYMYIHYLVQQAGYKTSIVPGITSFSASAAALNISLCEANETLHIIPASDDDYSSQLEYSGNKVLMKSGKQLKEVIDVLKEKDLYKNTMMVEKCSMEDEKISRNLDDVNLESSYFSLLIIKEKGLK